MAMEDSTGRSKQASIKIDTPDKMQITEGRMYFPLAVFNLKTPIIANKGKIPKEKPM